MPKRTHRHDEDGEDNGASTGKVRIDCAAVSAIGGSRGGRKSMKRAAAKEDCAAMKAKKNRIPKMPGDSPHRRRRLVTSLESPQALGPRDACPIPEAARSNSCKPARQEKPDSILPDTRTTSTDLDLVESEPQSC